MRRRITSEVRRSRLPLLWLLRATAKPLTQPLGGLFVRWRGSADKTPGEPRNPRRQLKENMAKIASISDEDYHRIRAEMAGVSSRLDGYNGFKPEGTMIHPLAIFGRSWVGWVKCEVILGRVVMTSRDGIGDRYENVWPEDFGETWQIPTEKFEQIFRSLYDDIGNHRIGNPSARQLTLLAPDKGDSPAPQILSTLESGSTAEHEPTPARANINPELSKKMLSALRHMKRNNNKLVRFPGGYWAREGWHSWNGPCWGTPTVEAIVRRGYAEYTVWKDGKSGRFPIECGLTPLAVDRGVQISGLTTDGDVLPPCR